jgi:hypothetical protein
MAKYLILLAGLLVSVAQADYRDSLSYEERQAYDDQRFQRDMAERDADARAREEEWNSSSPKMVITPSGTQTYYPGGSPNVWQSYDPRR